MNGSALAIEAAKAAVAGVSAVVWSSLSPRGQFWGRVYSRAPVAHSPLSHSPNNSLNHSIGNSDAYALTFDDGPTRASTPQILDILRQLNVRATFFIVGANARQCPDLLQRIHAEGHALGNHSYDHHHFAMFRGFRYWDRQVRLTDRIIEDVIGVRPAMFRPPMGIKTCCIMSAAARNGHAVITWSRRAMDGVRTTPGRILSRLAARAVPGDVLLLHDGVEPHGRRDPSVTISALRPLIQRLSDRGLRPVGLDDLLGISAYAPAPAEAAAA